MSIRRVVVAAAVGPVLASGLLGCGATSSAPEDPPRADPTLTLSGDWQLRSGRTNNRDLELQPGYPVTLVVDDTDGHLEAGGQSACNTYGAEVDVSGDELAFGNLESTAMGCVEPVLSLEDSYHSALTKVTSYRQTADQLVLTGPGTKLIYEPLPPVPTAELVDTVWQLESIITDDVASSVMGQPTLQLRRDGTFEMTSGCGLVLAGDWTEWNGSITFTSSSASGRCQQHPQSQAILNVSDSFYVEVEGDQLTVTGRHSGELVYRARTSVP